MSGDVLSSLFLFLFSSLRYLVVLLSLPRSSYPTSSSLLLFHSCLSIIFILVPFTTYLYPLSPPSPLFFSPPVYSSSSSFALAFRSSPSLHCSMYRLMTCHVMLFNATGASLRFVLLRPLTFHPSLSPAPIQSSLALSKLRSSYQEKHDPPVKTHAPSVEKHASPTKKPVQMIQLLPSRTTAELACHDLVIVLVTWIVP